MLSNEFQGSLSPNTYEEKNITVNELSWMLSVWRSLKIVDYIRHQTIQPRAKVLWNRASSDINSGSIQQKENTEKITEPKT